MSACVCVCTGWFPTQVVVCDLRQERRTRATALTEGGDLWGSAPCRLTTERLHFTLAALSSELWALTTNSNTPVCQRSQDSRITFQDHSCRTWDSCIQFDLPVAECFCSLTQVLFSLFCLLRGQAEENEAWLREEERSDLPPDSSSLSSHHTVLSVQLQTLCHLKKKKHFLHCLKYVRLFLMEYILKSL